MLRPNDIARAACILRDDLNNWRKRGLQLDADKVGGGGWSAYTEADALRVAVVSALAAAKVQLGEAFAIANEHSRHIAAVMQRAPGSSGPFIVTVSGFIPHAVGDAPTSYAVVADNMPQVVKVMEESQRDRDWLTDAVNVHWHILDLGTLADNVRRRLDITGYDDGVSKS